MIIKFFAGGKNASAKSSIDYLLGKDRNREQARLIKGDPDLSILIAESNKFNHNYTVGCLSFEEQNLSEELKREIISDFEKTFFAGLDDDQFNITWVEHQDKNRVELNFFIPKVELKTQKQLVPYFHKADFHLADSFQKVMNHKHNLSNPDDPAKTQLMKNDKKLTGSDKEIKEFLMSSISESFKKGTIENRADITNYLKELNLEITRETKKSISIKSPESNKNIRLDGEIFNQDFDFNQTLSQLDIDKKAFESNKNKDYEKALKTLSDFTEKRRNDFTQKYSTQHRAAKNEHVREIESDRQTATTALDKSRTRNVTFTQGNTTRTERQQEPLCTANRVDSQEANAGSSRSDSIADTSIGRESHSTENLEQITTATAPSFDYNVNQPMFSSIDKLPDDQRKIDENRATEFSRSTENLSRDSTLQRFKQVENNAGRNGALSIVRPEQGRDLQNEKRVFSNAHQLKGFDDVFNRIKELVKQLKSAIERSISRDRELTATKQATERTERTIEDFASKINSSNRGFIEIKRELTATEREIDTTKQNIDRTKQDIERADHDYNSTERAIRASEREIEIRQAEHQRNQNNAFKRVIERDDDWDFDI